MTTLPVQDPALPAATPRKVSRKPAGADRVFETGSRSIGAMVLVLIGGIGVFLAWQSVPTLERYGWSFFTESAWQPEADVLGIAAVLVGTVSVEHRPAATAAPGARTRCTPYATRDP